MQLAAVMNRSNKGSGVHFYRFPQDAKRKSQWIAAVGRKDWIPNDCSVHFVSGEKSNNTLSLDYVPSIFGHIKSPLKRKRYPLELSFCILRKSIKMNAGSFIESIEL